MGLLNGSAKERAFIEKLEQFHTSTCNDPPAFPDQKPAESVRTAERSNTDLVLEQRH